MRSRLHQVLLAWLAHDTFWLELALAATAAAWSKWVWLMPGDLVDRAAYVGVGLFAPDWLWDACGCLAAIVQAAAALRLQRVPRFLVAVLSAGFWIVVANGVGRSAPYSPTVVPYYALAAMNGLCAMLPLMRRLPGLR